MDDKKCSICGQDFKDYKYLHYHIQTQHEKKLFHCKKCTRGIQPRNKARHLKTCLVQHECPVCTKIFSSKQTYRKPIRYITSFKTNTGFSSV